RRAAEQHVDADQQSERPGRRARQASPDDGGQNEVNDAADQHPAPPSRKLLLVLESVQNRQHALDDKERDQEQRQRNGARYGPTKQADACRNGEHRRQERPPESGRMARPERGDQAHDSADEKQPTQENRDGDGGNGWNNDRQQAEDDEDDALDQEQSPML